MHMVGAAPSFLNSIPNACFKIVFFERSLAGRKRHWKPLLGAVPVHITCPSNLDLEVLAFGSILADGRCLHHLSTLQHPVLAGALQAPGQVLRSKPKDRG